MHYLPEAHDALMARLEALERRVYSLEHPTEKVETAVPEAQAATGAQAESAEEHPAALGGFSFPVLGKAMLGIAGAYLLRAVEGSGSLPRTAVAALAFVYALLWLAGAARSKAAGWFTHTTYSCTSALILAPMLWEVTLRFKALPPAAAAAALGVFVCAAMALAWRRNLRSIVWVANFGAVAVALPLSVASHQMTAFLVVLLLAALLSEIAETLERRVSALPLAALGAAAGVWGEIYIYSSSPDFRAEYPALGAAKLLAPGIALFLIVGAGVIYKTAIKGKKITIFETVLTMIAFLLAAFAWVDFGPAGKKVVLGVVCLVLCAAGYAVCFYVFKHAEHKRNFQVFAAWSVTLLTAGSLLCMPPLVAVACLGAAAVAVCVAGTSRKQPALIVHGMVYLAAAAVVSGLLNNFLQALAGKLPGLFDPEMWMAAVCSAMCFGVARPQENESWKRLIAPMVFLALTVAALMAFLVEGGMALIALQVVPGAHHLAIVRTLVLCATALGLAFGGARWRRNELTRAGYVVLALAAIKLVAEDLRQGHLGFIAGSIFLFAVALIAVPRIARSAGKA